MLIAHDTLLNFEQRSKVISSGTHPLFAFGHPAVFRVMLVIEASG